MAEWVENLQNESHSMSLAIENQNLEISKCQETAIELKNMKVDTQQNFDTVNRALDELNKLEGRIFAWCSN